MRKLYLTKKGASNLKVYTPELRKFIDAVAANDGTTLEVVSKYLTSKPLIVFQMCRFLQKEGVIRVVKTEEETPHG